MEAQSAGLPEQTGAVLKEEIHYLDIVDRIQYEIGMVEFIRNNTDEKDLEGACALLSESMLRTQKMLMDLGKNMTVSPDLQ